MWHRGHEQEPAYRGRHHGPAARIPVASVADAGPQAALRWGHHI